MFPYVCLLTMPIFCDDDWPATLWNGLILKNVEEKEVGKRSAIYSQEIKDSKIKQPEVKLITEKRLVVMSLILHCVIQCFLPYSHFITKASIVCTALIDLSL